MSKIDFYRERLRQTEDWDAYLLRESGLPGPRGNLELAHAVASIGSREQFLGWAAITPAEGPVNHPREFLAFCGILGIGWLVAGGWAEGMPLLRSAACDPRWRAREAVAAGLQYVGDADMDGLLREMRAWSAGSDYERRAVVAGLCEPRLLKDPERARAVLEILDEVMESAVRAEDRRGDGFQALRKALAYGWSVAAAALPEAGRPYLEKWAASPDKDARWIVKENLKKNRLLRLDPAWVRRVLDTLEKS